MPDSLMAEEQVQQRIVAAATESAAEERAWIIEQLQDWAGEVDGKAAWVLVNAASLLEGFKEHWTAVV